MASGPLTEPQVREYHERGFVLAKGMFDASEIGLLSRAAREDRELDQYSYRRADGEGGTVRLSLWNHPGDTLQAEVVDRIRAQPGTPEYGLLTVLLAESYLPGPSFRIPASCFFPAPDVASACIRLDYRTTQLIPTGRSAAFRELAKRAFSQRRKQLRGVLRAYWPETSLDRAFSTLALPRDTRAETLSPETLARLSEELA